MIHIWLFSLLSKRCYGPCRSPEEDAWVNLDLQCISKHWCIKILFSLFLENRMVRHFNMSSVHLAIQYYHLFKNCCGPSFEQIWIPFTKKWFVPHLFEIDLLVLEKQIFSQAIGMLIACVAKCKQKTQHCSIITLRNTI